MSQIQFRYNVNEEDINCVRRIVESTDSFLDFEINVAVELVEENLEKGSKKSGYYFVFAEIDKRVVGYACFGHIPCTKSSFDLYWIAVDKSYQGKKIGKLILSKVEELALEMNCTRIYIETASKDCYKSTQKFYLNSGYNIEATLEGFYDEGDSKLVFVKKLVV